MDKELLIIGLGTTTSVLCFNYYKKEVKKYGHKKEFWKFQITKGFTGFRGFLNFIGWNIILIAAIPAGILWRLSKWMQKSSKN